jgi:hypothetical protein
MAVSVKLAAFAFADGFAFADISQLPSAVLRGKYYGTSVDLLRLPDALGNLLRGDG